MSPSVRHPLGGLLAGLFLVACGSDTVIPQPDGGPVASVAVTPGAVALPSLGVTATLAVELRDAENQLTQGTVTWMRRGTGATTVSGTGVVTAIANGTDTVVATANGVSGEAVVTVAQEPVAIVLNAQGTTLTRLGATVTVTATVRDANGRALPGGSVVFSSSNPQALPVTQGGIVTAARPGAAQITATSGTVTASVPVTVALSSPVGGPILGAAVPCQGGTAGPFPCQGVDLLSFLPVSGLGGVGVELNDLWGWTDPTTGKEIAIVLRSDGTTFVDVTDPLRPDFLGFMPITPGAQVNVWHDVKVYKDHAYVVADGAGPHGMQVFDLTRLRAHAGVPRTFTPDVTYANINSAHNIFINEATGYAYIVGASAGGTTCGGGLHIVDIRTPKSPTFVGCFADPLTGRVGSGYTHDVQCVVYAGPDAAYQGREICFGSNETAISIADVTNKLAPVALSRSAYPQVRYTHQGWLTADQRYFLVNDELDEIQTAQAGTRTLIWDVADLEDPVLVGQFLGPNPATDHNHYIRGTLMYASTYQFGLRMVDVSNPLAPQAVGHFDTAPNFPNTPGFGGSWSNYPFFASGNIVVTSQQQGLFILRRP